MRHDEELAIAGVVGVEDLRLRARRHVEELDALLGHGALARAEDGVDHLRHGTAGRGTATTVVEEHGVEEAATIDVVVVEFNFEQVVDDIMALNPHITNRVCVTQGARFNEDGTLKEWDLYNIRLRLLPDSFGSVNVGRELDLSENELCSLPDSFGSIIVGSESDVLLYQNPVASASPLPELPFHVFWDEYEYDDEIRRRNDAHVRIAIAMSDSDVY